MSEQHYFKYTYSVLLVPMFLVLSIWTVFWVELKFHVNLNDFGVYPRTVSGLKGVLFSPFVHGSLDHLYSNTLPTAILSASLFYFYRQVAWKVLFYGILLSGVLTWVIGRPSYHIGISGLIYVLASFIFFKGIFTKYYRLTALSMFVVFIYGGLLWYIFPIEDGISWEGHMAGFVTGLFLALVLKVQMPSLKKYAWEREDYNEEEDAFLKHFDENGNFIELPEENLEDPEDPVKITYFFKEKKNNSDS